MLCADTSFLLSLTGNDSNSPAAVARVQTLSEPVNITALNRLEFEKRGEAAAVSRGDGRGRSYGYTRRVGGG